MVFVNPCLSQPKVFLSPCRMNTFHLALNKTCFKLGLVIGEIMSCSRSQLLALLDFILKEILDSRDKEEAYQRVLRIRSRVQEMTFDDIVREFGL